MANNFVAEKYTAKKLSEFKSSDSLFSKLEEIKAELEKIHQQQSFKYVKNLFLEVLRNRSLLQGMIGKEKRTRQSVSSALFLVVAYQLHFENRDPALLLDTLKNSLKGFIEEKLRRAIREIGDASLEKLPSGVTQKDKIKFLSLKYSFEPWVVKRMVAQHGGSEAEKMLACVNQRNPVYFIVNSLLHKPDAILGTLKEAGVRFEATDLNGVYKLVDGFLSRSSARNKESILILDKASALVAHVLNPQPGDYVLDACAAPGNKAVVMAQLMRNRGKIFAADIDPERLKKLSGRMDNTGVEIIQCFFQDSRKIHASKKVSGVLFDKVLVDPTCSSIGAYYKNPHLKWRYSERDLNKLVKNQAQVLDSATRLLKDGGEVVYSVCSLLKEEGEGVIGSFLDRNRDFALLEALPLIGEKGKGRFSLAQYLYPHKHQAEGFFIAKLKKISGWKNGSR
jgi:16S rRNA (cytosine967-C5)-methyltransferase